MPLPLALTTGNSAIWLLLLLGCSCAVVEAEMMCSVSIITTTRLRQERKRAQQLWNLKKNIELSTANKEPEPQLTNPEGR